LLETINTCHFVWYVILVQMRSSRLTITFAAVIQNHLQFVAISNLEAATFQVSYQIKILTTAAFSVLLLRKKLSPSQWLALLTLAIGVGFVQMQAVLGGTARTPSNILNLHSMNQMKGFLAVIAACLTSGLAGVYFEMVLKGSQGDVWVRNIQLSLFSLLPALSPILLAYAGQRGSRAQVHNFASLFNNFGPWAWATVAIQVAGGLLTAIVIKYSDNILKGFATSLSIVISFLASIALFDFRITCAFLVGSLLVVFATWLYNQHRARGCRSVMDEGNTGHKFGWRECATFTPCSDEDDELSRCLSASTQSLSSQSHSTLLEPGWENDKISHFLHGHSAAQ
jgi:solute carrier family 35 (UDP-sugar transporter), member A1/2/3